MFAHKIIRGVEGFINTLVILVIITAVITSLIVVRADYYSKLEPLEIRSYEKVYLVKISDNVFDKYGNILVYNSLKTGVSYEEYLFIIQSKMNNLLGKDTPKKSYISYNLTKTVIEDVKNMFVLGEDHIKELSMLGLKVKSILVYEHAVVIRVYNGSQFKLDRENINRVERILYDIGINTASKKVIIYETLEPPGYPYVEIGNKLVKAWDKLKKYGVYSIGYDLTGLRNILVDVNILSEKNVSVEEVVRQVKNVIGDKSPIVIAFTKRSKIENNLAIENRFSREDSKTPQTDSSNKGNDNRSAPVGVEDREIKISNSFDQTTNVLTLILSVIGSAIIFSILWKMMIIKNK